MSKKQTAMQELIAEFKDIQRNKCKTAQEVLFFDGVLAIIEAKYLSKEREQIEEAYIDGMEFIPVDPNKYKSDAEQYYTQTYGECTRWGD